ncbi:MAG: recombination protein RecR [Endozoicomonadaceae bacterium]|nr:recombination protein RecR [Endozoicomonadaceae bacterium]
MNIFPASVQQLIKSFMYLPGIGPKSAERMALYLLGRYPAKGKTLADSLSTALEKVSYCLRCRHFSEKELCVICSDSTRDERLLCIVETASDLSAMEQSGGYNGYYFVLMGRLSPIDGVGPEELGLTVLLSQLASEKRVHEVILATNSTIEGEATAYFLVDQMKTLGLKVSRLANGVPLGSELEYMDKGTLTCALDQRHIFES